MEKTVVEGVRERRVRVALAVTLGTVAAGYTVGVLVGWLPEHRQINATHLAVLVVAGIGIVFLLRPHAFDRLTRVDIAGVKLEMERQADRLDELSRILPLLLPTTERNHVVNLAAGTTASYVGGHSLRTELRRLRSVGLIRMRGSHHVGEMADGTVLDLADYVTLTPLGTWWAEKSQELQEAEKG